MQKTRRVFVNVCVVFCLAGVIVVAGCGEATQQQRGRNLRRDTKKAQDLYNQALQLLASPYYKDAKSGEASPIVKRPIEASSDIAFPTGSELNPKAIQAIDQACALLTDSLKNNAGADPADEALARKVLARALLLRAFCESHLARAGRGDADSMRTEIEAMLSIVRAKGTLYSHYQQLRSASTQEVENIMAEAERNSRQLSGQLKTLAANLVELDRKLKETTQAHMKLEGQASSLLTQSVTTTGPAGLKLVEQSLAKQIAADSARAQASQLEYEINLKTAQHRDLAVRREAHADTAKAAAGILKDRSDEDEQLKGAEAEVLKQLQATQAKIVTLLGKLAETCTNVAQAQKRAAQAYKQAGASLKQAASVYSDEAGTPESLAAQAEVCAKQAALASGGLEFHEKNLTLIGRVEKAWQSVSASPAMPKAASDIKSFLDDPAKRKTKASDHYKEAVRLYKMAASAAEPKLKWAYQGELASAYLGWYQLTLDATHLSEAKKVLDKAAKDKESSPYLVDVIRLREAVDRASK